MRNIYLIILLIVFNSCQKELKSITNHTHLNNSVIINKPNIILILIDDMGYEIPNINGGQSCNTPNLNSLGLSNLRFTQVHSCPLCSPSRMQLLTGKYNFRNDTQWGQLSDTAQTIGNLMKKAGYTTGWFGKDQLGGGDKSLTAWGFDEYCVHDAFTRKERLSRYRNPHLYTHGAFLPDSLVLNKYGEDIVRDSAFQFMKASINNNTPFFLYYPMLLVHEPFQPTPDDPNFLTWDITKSDTLYYKSMVEYCDKVIGQIINKVSKLGIEDNTVIIITADNGTPKQIISTNNGIPIRGDKSNPTEYGTHVPFIVKWPGHTPIGIDSNLIDFTGILPTLADIAQVNIPARFGVTDGTSFYHNVIGTNGENRKWIYNYFNPHPEDGEDVKNQFAIYVQNERYKLFDTVYPSWRQNKLLDFTKDFYEKDKSIIVLNKTKEQKNLYSLFRNVLDSMKLMY